VVRGLAVATGYVQRLGFFAIEYITFRAGKKERRGADDKEH
jgi:hypothetical protein